MSLYNPAAMLSNQYSLGALSVTNQQLNEPNLPTALYMYENLEISAQILEYLAQKVGPFLLISGFRTKELQNKLSEQGEPTSSGMSFHEVGRGFDISPTTMTIEEFFGRMLADPEVKSQFAEIALKPSQNALHIATNVPGDVRDPKITGLTQDGIYARLGIDQIAAYIAPFMDSAEDAYDYAAAELVTWNKTPLIIGMVAALGAGLYFMLNSGAGRVQRNPRIKLRKSVYKPFSRKDELKAERDKKIIRLYKKGFSLREVGNMFGLAIASVQQIITAYETQTKTKIAHKPNRIENKELVQKVIKSYKSGNSVQSTSQKLGVPLATVYDMLHRHSAFKKKNPYPKKRPFRGLSDKALKTRIERIATISDYRIERDYNKKREDKYQYQYDELFKELKRRKRNTV